MLHVFHGMGVYNFFSNILEYVQISKPIIVYIFLKFNNIFPIYIKQYYNYVIKILLLNYVIYIYTPLCIIVECKIHCMFHYIKFIRIKKYF